jgi:beta-xylosidase
MRFRLFLSGLLWLGAAHLTVAIWNPIISGWNPDPSILRVKEDYYIVTSSMEVFPGLPIYHS